VTFPWDVRSDVSLLSPKDEFLAGTFNINMPRIDDTSQSTFLRAQSRQDLAFSLGIEYRILTYNLWKLSDDERYKEFAIRKRNGDIRIITAPDSGIKFIQKKLSLILLELYPPKSCVHGFVKQRQIKSNALQHVHAKFLVNVDLEDFFPSINFGRIRGLFKSYPFNFNDEVATTLAQICCHKGVLPQGAPTSPILSNFVCRRLDNALMFLARAHRCHYSRYADDISISTNLRKLPEAFGRLEGERFLIGEDFARCIADNGFRVNESKTRFATRLNRQSVTGLVVNRKVNVDRRYIRNVRAMIHAWDKFTLEEAAREHFSKPNQQLPESKDPALAFQERVIGRVGYIGWVRGKDDALYRHLRARVKMLAPGANLPAIYTTAEGLPATQIYGEGKTDPMHLSAALAHFRASGEFENLVVDFPAPPEMSNSRLLRMCELHSGDLRNKRMFIAVFDRDDEETLRKVTDEPRPYKIWGNHVYSFAIPKPTHRAFQKVCIEHLYTDAELMTRDSSGRRIYLGSEFDIETGAHLNENVRFTTPAKLKRGYPIIIDRDVANEQGVNVALSKADFADYVRNKIPAYDNFSFESFRQVFKIIRAIMENHPT
jgi:RNA-directed DNA polymerase